MSRPTGPGASIGAVRELRPDELTLLNEPRPKRSLVKRFRDSHHMIARLAATGMRASAIAGVSGYSLNRVTMFLNDPAFIELVASYRNDPLLIAASLGPLDAYAELVTANGLKAERMLRDKLDDADENEELLPTKDLLAISRDAADRFGYGKRSTQVNVNVDFAAQLDRAIKRSGKVIEAVATYSGAPPDTSNASLQPRSNVVQLVPSGESPNGKAPTESVVDAPPTGRLRRI